MDYKELAEKLRNNNVENNCHDCSLGYYAFEAATAISDLLSRAEAAEAGQKTLQRAMVEYKERAETAEREAKEAQREATLCRNGWKKAEMERDAAVSDIETILAYGDVNLDTCQYCKNGQCYARGGTKPCFPKWRGEKEE